MVSFTTILGAVSAISSVFAMPVAERGFVADSINSTDTEHAEAMFELMRRQSTPSSQGTNNGYFFSWWTDGASPVTYTNGADGAYSVDWQAGGNFVGGKGWNPGGAKTVSYTGTWSPVDNGNAVSNGLTRDQAPKYTDRVFFSTSPSTDGPAALSLNTTFSRTSANTTRPQGPHPRALSLVMVSCPASQLISTC